MTAVEMSEDEIRLHKEIHSLRAKLADAEGRAQLAKKEMEASWRELVELKEAAAAATTSNHVLGPPARTRLQQVLDAQQLPDTYAPLTPEWYV